MAPPPQLEHYVFGYREPTADMMWLRALQDFDYCEEPISAQLCKGNSWLAQMLDSITDLSPYFRMPYALGPLALSVLLSDIEGASHMFDKGVAHFPEDWRILYRAAYHALYEEKNDIKAAGLMQRAAKNGAPEWAYALATRLYSRAGHEELASRLYEDMKQDGFDEALLERMRQHIEKNQTK